MEDIIGFAAQIKKAQRIVKNKNLQPISVTKNATVMPSKPVSLKQATVMPSKPVSLKQATVMPSKPVLTKQATVMPIKPVQIQPVDKTFYKAKTLVPQIIPAKQIKKFEDKKQATVMPSKPVSFKESVLNVIKPTQTKQATVMPSKPVLTKQATVMPSESKSSSTVNTELNDVAEQSKQPNNENLLLIGGGALALFYFLSKRK